MSVYSIIEDCSPYYIRFTHSGIDEVISTCKKIADSNVYTKPFTHYRFDKDLGESVIKLLPMSNQLKFIKERVSFFVTQPGVYYRAHKDGLNFRCGINYTIKVLDDQCVTSWYSDEDLQEYEIDNLPSKTSREAINFNKSAHTPLKSMIAVQHECILFNTEIYHDFDNSKSQNERIVLTLRLENPSNMYFDDVKKILFG
jgi:hypothetical protein